MMRKSDRPIALAPCTYSISRTDSTMERTTRVKAGVNTMPIAIKTLVNPGPKAVVMASARMMVGNDHTASVMDEITVSMRPL